MKRQGVGQGAKFCTLALSTTVGLMRPLFDRLPQNFHLPRFREHRSVRGPENIAVRALAVPLYQFHRQKSGKVVLGGAAFAAKPSGKPNIVVILVDDLGFYYIGC